MVARGEIWWADFEAPVGSQPGFLRPVVIVQSDLFNESPLRTVVVVPLTSNMGRGRAAGNVEIPPGVGGLPKPSVAVVTQISAIDLVQLTEQIGELPANYLARLAAGIRIALDL